MTAVRAIRLLTVVLAIAGVLLVGQSVLADRDLPDIPAHRHYVQTATGEVVQVGPRVCDDSALQNAFNQFHSNVHVHVEGSTGPEPSAPGLHNGDGAEITAGPC